MKTTKTLTLADLQARWIGRKLYSSVTPQCGRDSDAGREITEVRYNAKVDKFVAWNGEHHMANSPAALDRLLQSLAVRY